MRSDFSTVGRCARELIPVPDLSIELIRGRSHTARARGRSALILFAAIFFALTAAGVGFGEKIYDGVRVWLSGDRLAVVVRSFGMVRRPTRSDLRNVIARATFPIVFPVDIPAGTRVTMIMFAPAGRPNSVFVEYRNERANFKVGFSLFDSAIVNAGDVMVPPGQAWSPFGAVYQWRVGRETVLVPKAFLSSREVNRIKAAMVKVSPPASVAVTETMLRKVTVLGGTPELADVAERYAPRIGRSVLLDREQVRSISSLVKQGRPMLDSRTVYLSNIPSVHGKPDYSKATLNWPKVIAVSAGGVRAIETVLRSTGTRVDCRCEILFNQPGNTTYWVWKIPLSASPTVRKYSVDAKTLIVRPAI